MGNPTKIGHFRVSPGLCFKTRVGAQPLIWKSLFILMQIKLIFTRKVAHLASFWKWGFWNSEVAYWFSVFKKVLVYTYRFHCFRLSTCIRSQTGMDIGLKLFSKICSFELSCLIRKFVLTSNSFASWFNNSEPLMPVRSFYASIFGSGKSSRTNFVLIWKKGRNILPE